MNEDQKVEAVILKLDENSYRPTDADLKELVSGITRSHGAIITQLMQKPIRFLKVHTYLSEKMMNLDKTFYSGLFTMIKQSPKWNNQSNALLLIGLIPKILSIHSLSYFREKTDDRVQMVEVVMYTFYAEYFDSINLIQDKKDQESSNDLLKCFPELQKKYDAEWREQKRNNQFSKINQITSNNVQETYELLLELFYSKILLMNDKIYDDFIQMAMILCGAQLNLDQLNIYIDYKNIKFSTFAVQLSDKCLEILLLGAYTISTLKKQIQNSSLLIQMLLKKCGNESRFNLVGLAQSTQELTQDVYEGVF